MSCVRCQVSSVFFFLLQSGVASRGRVCYQQGLPRLAYDLMKLGKNHLLGISKCNSIQVPPQALLGEASPGQAGQDGKALCLDEESGGQTPLPGPQVK